MKPRLKALLVDHIQERAKARYGKELRRDQLRVLTRKLRNGKYSLLREGEFGRIECKVSVGNDVLRVIYDESIREVITLLPIDNKDIRMADVFPEDLQKILRDR